MPTTKQVKLIDKHNVIKKSQDKNPETFIIYIAVLKAEILIHLLQTVQIAALQWDKALNEILTK